MTIVRLIDLPSTINALVSEDSDGDYNIYINARLSFDEARKALEHEKRHILLNHFHRDVPVKLCEEEV